MLVVAVALVEEVVLDLVLGNVPVDVVAHALVVPVHVVDHVVVIVLVPLLVRPQDRTFLFYTLSYIVNIILE